MRIRPWWVLLAVIGLAGPVLAQPSPEVPWTLRQNAVRATLRDYDARLQAEYRQRLAGWLSGFVQRRAARSAAAGERLAKLAAEIRDRRSVSWKAVGQDPEFLAEARKVAAELLTADEVRAELTAWAREVESETRLEMLRCFQQIIASDLGLKFDQNLRGRVEAAVKAIPIEKLVADGVSQEQLVTAIQAGLPGVILTDEQKESIALAAGELARRGAQWVAVTQLSLPPDWTEFLSNLAAMGTAWAAAQGLEWVDRFLSGEPQPEQIARQLAAGLDAWNRRQLKGRLENILTSYRFQVIKFVDAEGKAAAEAVEIGPPR